MMNIPGRKKQLDQNAVPTTSLADMMFLLLIFFIMTTTLARTTGFVTDVPAGQKGQSDTPDKTPTVQLHDGKLSVDDKAMTFAELKQFIQGLQLEKKTGEAKVVIVEAAGSVTYQQYYEVLALIRTSGGTVAIVAGAEEKK